MTRRDTLVLTTLLMAGIAGCQPHSAGSGTAVATTSAGVAGPSTGVKFPGKPNPMDLSRDQLKAIEDVTAILEKIQDDASADAVLPDLKNAAVRLRRINEQMMSLQRVMTDADRAAAEAQFNDPAVQKHIEKVMEAGSKMMDASFNAQLKAPGKRKEIQAACDMANAPKPPNAPKRK